MLNHSDPLLFVDHIRGRVRGPVRYATNGRPIWALEVYRVGTGEVINSDDAFSLSAAVQDAAERTHIARYAWFYGFSKGKLSRGRR